MRDKHYRALRWAVLRAEEWRGSSLVGNPNPAPLAAFDRQINLCREALKEIPTDGLVPADTYVPGQAAKDLGIKVKGFTFVEFLVVLVIVGLLLEMVLAGGSAIHAARVHDIVAQQEGLKAAFMGFEDRYRALPGDYAGAPDALARAAGNGNGRIDPEEQTLAFVHLAAAGYTSTAAPSNVYGLPITVAFDNAYGDGAQAPHHNIKTGGGVPSAILAEADRKIDDGLPYSGNFQAVNCALLSERAWAPDASDCTAVTVLK